MEKKGGLGIPTVLDRVIQQAIVQVLSPIYEDIKYLGYGFYYTKMGIVKPKPHLKSIQKFKRRLKQLTKRNVSISLSDRIKQLNYVIRGWVNCFRIGDMKSWLKSITSHCCIIWKQWKTSRKRIESLIKLGCKKEQAKAITYSRKSYWNSSLYISIFNYK